MNDRRQENYEETDYLIYSKLGGIKLSFSNSQRIFELMSSLFFIDAAESFSPSGGDSPASSGPSSPTGSSRRDRFNFIAEVVEETAPALVYIQVGDSASFRHCYELWPSLYASPVLF